MHSPQQTTRRRSLRRSPGSDPETTGNSRCPMWRTKWKDADLGTPRFVSIKTKFFTLDELLFFSFLYFLSFFSGLDGELFGPSFHMPLQHEDWLFLPERRFLSRPRRPRTGTTWSCDHVAPRKRSRFRPQYGSYGFESEELAKLPKVHNYLTINT